MRFAFGPRSRCAGKPPVLQTSRGYTLIEVVVAAGVMTAFLSGVFAVTAHALTLLHSTKEAAAATQVLQQRMEQVRSAAWTEITSEYPPKETNYLPPIDDDPLIPDDILEIFDTGLLNELTDGLDENVPGLAQLLKIKVPALNTLLTAVGLPAVSERMTVTPFPHRPIEPIQIVRDATGAVDVKSHNSQMVFEKLVRVDVRITWRDRKGVVHLREASTLVTPSPRQL